MKPKETTGNQRKPWRMYWESWLSPARCEFHRSPRAMMDKKRKVGNQQKNAKPNEITVNHRKQTQTMTSVMGELAFTSRMWISSCAKNHDFNFGKLENQTKPHETRWNHREPQETSANHEECNGRAGFHQQDVNFSVHQERWWKAWKIGKPDKTIWNQMKPQETTGNQQKPWRTCCESWPSPARCEFQRSPRTMVNISENLKIRQNYQKQMNPQETTNKQRKQWRM